LVNWDIELREFYIKIHMRMSFRGQAIANFIVEFNNIPKEEEGPKQKTWIAYVNVSSTRKNSGARVILKGPNHKQ
jgi:hypothetical protein